MLDPHQDHPGGGVRADRQLERHRWMKASMSSRIVADSRARLHCRPVVVRRVEVVPRHLVDADGEHRLEPRVDPLRDQPARDQLVDVEHGRMGEVEDQRMAERLVAFVIRGVVADEREQAFVEFAGRVKVAAEFRPLGGFRVGPGRVGVEQRLRSARGAWRGRRSGRPAAGDRGRGRGVHGWRASAREETYARSTLPPAQSLPRAGRESVRRPPRSAPTTAPRWQLSPPHAGVGAARRRRRRRHAARPGTGPRGRRRGCSRRRTSRPPTTTSVRLPLPAPDLRRRDPVGALLEDRWIRRSSPSRRAARASAPGASAASSTSSSLCVRPTCSRTSRRRSGCLGPSAATSAGTGTRPPMCTSCTPQLIGLRPAPRFVKKCAVILLDVGVAVLAGREHEGHVAVEPGLGVVVAVAAAPASASSIASW